MDRLTVVALTGTLAVLVGKVSVLVPQEVHA